MQRTSNRRPAAQRATGKHTVQKKTLLKGNKKFRTTNKRKFASISTKPIQQQRATIFGAYGTIGPYVTQYLGPTGMRIVIPYRDDSYFVRPLKVCGDVGQVSPLQFDWTNEDSIRRTMVGSDLVINMIGTSSPTIHFNEFDANLRTAIRVAKIAKEEGVERFIHVSAAGASPIATSKFLRAKFESEEAVKAYFPNASIIRPCFTFDVNNMYLNGLARSSAQPKASIVYADTLIQPTYARDVGAAIAQIALHSEIDGQTWTLGGQKAITRMEIFQKFQRMTAYDRSEFAADQNIDPMSAQRSFLVFMAEQAKFASTQNRLTPRGEIDYFASDITLASCEKTKGFAELGIQASDTDMTLLRIAKPYLTNLAPANQGNLFTWSATGLDAYSPAPAAVGTH